MKSRLFVASSACIAALAVMATATTVLTGCGGSDSSSSVITFTNRAVAGAASFADGRSAGVQVQTDAAGTANALVQILSAARATPVPLSAHRGRAVLATVNLKGTVDLHSGAVRLSGSYGNSNEVPVELVGVLPGGIGTSAGTFDITVGGVTSHGFFTSIAPITGTPLPTASPSVSPSVSPSPSPSGSPGATDVARFFPLHTGDTYTYNHSGSGSTTTTTTTTRTGNLVTVPGTTNQAFRQEDLGNDTTVDSVDYVNVTDQGYITYGFDDLNPDGSVNSSTRYNPPFIIPASVINNGAGDFSYSYTDNSGGTTFTVKVSGRATPQGTVSVTVPAGTFSALKVLVHSVFTFSTTGFSSTSTQDATEYLVDGVGLVKSDATTTSSTATGGTQTTTSSDVLVRATVNGVSHP